MPPGPKTSLFASLTYGFSRDPLTYLSTLVRTYGDLASYRMGGELIFFVNDPVFIQEILVTDHRNFTKSRGLERTRRLLGNGLLTSEGEFHRRQRRLMQPAFHRERIESYGRTMVAHAERVRSSWSRGAEIDVAQEMAGLTLSIAGKTLFDVDVQAQAAEIGNALTEVMSSFWLAMMPFGSVIERLPVGRMRRARLARERLDAIVYDMIAKRRRAGGDRGDLLSMLLLARDEDDRTGMTDQQVRDEAMTTLLAGHETTANALTWTWYLLSQAPAAEAALQEEVGRALGGRLPTVADIPSLPYVERVVTEAMRLYPPAWILGRRAIGPHPVGGYVAPPRTIFLMSPWVMHRDGRYFPDPERFDPDRWTPEFKAALPRFAYFPFGGGPRRCIGEPFAWMELVLVVATMAQRWKLRLVPGHPVVPQPLVTLRAKHGMRMTVQAA
jgi:cytochrome P450